MNEKGLPFNCNIHDVNLNKGINSNRKHVTALSVSKYCIDAFATRPHDDGEQQRSEKKIRGKHFLCLLVLWSHFNNFNFDFDSVDRSLLAVRRRRPGMRNKKCTFLPIFIFAFFVFSPENVANQTEILLAPFFGQFHQHTHTHTQSTIPCSR